MAHYSYPDGRVIAYDYGVDNSISDRLGRIHRIRETDIAGTVLAEYAYNGTDAERKMHSASGNYDALDRFGRPVTWAWTKRSSGAVLDRYSLLAVRRANVPRRRLFRETHAN